MSTNVQPGGAYGVNLDSQSLEEGASARMVTDFPSGSFEYNRRMNWEMAAQMERVERQNISWWRSSSKTVTE